jgi:hypothetical protein
VRDLVSLTALWMVEPVSAQKATIHLELERRGEHVE